ncbi:MAG: GntR family transcriptional regulator [Ruminococcaceae bacterium]|nr:GntR family transcriptional regulator [Oscillospiraceae bacterium]
MIVDAKSQSLEEMVYSTLEEEILSGELERGTSLGEIALAKRLGVSRTPIRGALHRLSEEGLVEISPNRGATVIGINATDLVDIYMLRERLEGLASSLAAARITKEELERLTETVELAEFYISKNDAEHLKELDTVFHSIIYRASGSRFLAGTLSELHRKIKSYRKRSLSVPGRVHKSENEHREILEAIKRGDAEMADRLTSLHVRRALDNMLTAIEK